MVTPRGGSWGDCTSFIGEARCTTHARVVCVSVCVFTEAVRLTLSPQDAARGPERLSTMGDIATTRIDAGSPIAPTCRHLR